MSFYENVLSYSEEKLHTAYISTMYSLFILKMLLFILWIQYIILTLRLCRARLF